MTAKKIADIAESLEKLGYEVVEIEEERGILQTRSLRFNKFINIKLGFIDPNAKSQS
jgi:hypothetical protein